MTRFRFRAQAALDLRHRELDESQRVLARAEADWRVALEHVAVAEAALAKAKSEADEAMRAAPASSQSQWYPFWIRKLNDERAERRATLERRVNALAFAQNACSFAKQRCESLGRFRELAQAAHVASEAATERKAFDELAARRFVGRRNSTEGVVS